MSDDRSTDSASRDRRPQYFDDPAVDRLHTMCLALAAELSVAYDRIDALERVLEAKGLLQRAEVEQFSPDERAEAERTERREAFLRRILQTFTDQRDQLVAGGKRGRDTEV